MVLILSFVRRLLIGPGSLPITGSFVPVLRFGSLGSVRVVRGSVPAPGSVGEPIGGFPRPKITEGGGIGRGLLRISFVGYCLLLGKVLGVGSFLGLWKI